MDFEANFEIDRTADYIHSHNFTRVALQFPDELLKDSIRVVKELREKLRALRKCDDDDRGGTLVEGKRDVGLYVMADTAYGSCCVDEVGAAHINAECVVHYGHTCLSPTSTLPAFFVFGKACINVSDCAQKICTFASSCNKPILVLLGLEYTYAIHDLKGTLEDEALKLSTSSSKLDINCASVLSSTVAPPTGQMTSNGQAEVVNNLSSFPEAGDAEVHTSYSISGLTWNIPHGQRIEDYLVFWIGLDNSAFANVVLTLNACEIVRYVPAEKSLITDVSQITRILQRRYYLVEKAKDAGIVGILVGTLGVAGYLHMIHQMKDLVTKAGKKAYTIVVGRPNPAKLANFPECDVFVYVSCAQTALLDSKEFLAPIITPFEAMLAFKRGSQWTGAYTMEFRDLMNMPSCGVEVGTDEPRFSFILGRYVEDLDHEEIADDSEGLALAISTEKALRLRDKDVNTLANIDPKSGAEFLAMRSYQGLDIHHDGSMPKPIVIGRTGRAAGYENEKSQ
ncbi:2-(3-amino-3-carboxypropyl)histidine synthase subunit 2-like [Chenopodium quinoa]|uniref:2-(3-amino-3-carboxypropyl)histidine synthase subunit 2 n=1 Tax=Chenopodium quinoa TaxID=63459 RepID=A0A803MC91_CHEQI|nr:2-(3-amino-3-carboxypropyl)histidine synthase subunit 2-like [Chenopodium quinoa]